MSKPRRWRDPKKPVMTVAAERILRWSFLSSLVLFIVVIVIVALASNE